MLLIPLAGEGTAVKAGPCPLWVLAELWASEGGRVITEGVLGEAGAVTKTQQGCQRQPYFTEAVG